MVASTSKSFPKVPQRSTSRELPFLTQVPNNALNLVESCRCVIDSRDAVAALNLVHTHLLSEASLNNIPGLHHQESQL